jgi:hypothetical protein
MPNIDILRQRKPSFAEGGGLCFRTNISIPVPGVHQYIVATNAGAQGLSYLRYYSMLAEDAVALVAAAARGDKGRLGLHPDGAAAAHQEAVGQGLALPVFLYCNEEENIVSLRWLFMFSSGECESDIRLWYLYKTNNKIPAGMTKFLIAKLQVLSSAIIFRKSVDP